MSQHKTQYQRWQNSMWYIEYVGFVDFVWVLDNFFPDLLSANIDNKHTNSIYHKIEFKNFKCLFN